MADRDENSLTKQHEDVAESVARKAVDSMRKLRERFGDRPWGGDRLTRAEKQSAFAEVRAVPTAWQEIVQREQDLMGLAPDRYPRDLIEDAVRLEKRHREGKD